MTTVNNFDTRLLLQSLLDEEGGYYYKALQDSGLTREDLLSEMAKGDVTASIILLYGMRSHRYMRCMEDFEDEDTGETVKIELDRITDEWIFEPEPTLFADIETMVISSISNQTDDILCMWKQLFSRKDIPSSIVGELAKRGYVDSLEWMGDYYAGNFSNDPVSPIDIVKAKDYYDKALEKGLTRKEYDNDIERLDFGGARRKQDQDWMFPDDSLESLEQTFLYSRDDFSFEDLWTCAINDMWNDYSFWSYLFPWHIDDKDRQTISVQTIVDELISKGIPASAIQDYENGLLVKFRNLSYYIVTGPDKDGCLGDSQLGVSPHFHELPQDNQFHCLIEVYRAPEVVDRMISLNAAVPEVKMELSDVFFCLKKEKAVGKVKTVAAKEYISSLFQGNMPAEISEVSMLYRFGEKVWDCVHFMVNNGDLPRSFSVSFENLRKLDKEFFIWIITYPDLPSGSVVIKFDEGLGKEQAFLEHNGYQYRCGTPPTIFR